MPLIIRDATEFDLGDILQIERTSFVDAWTVGMFHAHLHGATNIFLVAEYTEPSRLNQTPVREERFDHTAVTSEGDTSVESSSRQGNEPTGRIVGFSVAQVVADEAEILDIAVTVPARGQGIGGALLDATMSRCHERGADTVFLEVRESNTAARALYAGRRFIVAGRRRHYYHTPTEDGLILRANIPVSTGSPAKVQ